MYSTIDQALHHAASFLRNCANPTLEAQVLLSAVLKKDRVWLKTHNQNRLSFTQFLHFWWWCMCRRCGQPVAYIRGFQLWSGQRFLVNRHVLIPRDETEIMLGYILEQSEESRVKSVLDIGTGSGCLAIECQRAWPEATVTAIDISHKALQVAQKNDHLHQQSVHFIQSDLLGNIDSEGHFDLIVANLPYVPTTMPVSREVDKEPRLAVFSGADGLDHIRRLATELKTKKITFNQCWLEFLPTQKTDVAEIFNNYQVELKTDVGGKVFFACVMPRRGQLS